MCATVGKLFATKNPFQGYMTDLLNLILIHWFVRFLACLSLTGCFLIHLEIMNPLKHTNCCCYCCVICSTANPVSGHIKSTFNTTFEPKDIVSLLLSSSAPHPLSKDTPTTNAPGLFHPDFMRISFLWYYVQRVAGGPVHPGERLQPVCQVT